MDTQPHSRFDRHRDVESDPTPIRQRVKNSCDKVGGCVQENPRTSMLISLGAGLSLGVALGAMLAGSRAGGNRWYERRTAEHLGERLLSQMGTWLPDAISDRLSR